MKTAHMRSIISMVISLVSIGIIIYTLVEADTIVKLIVVGVVEGIIGGVLYVVLNKGESNGNTRK